MDRHWTGKEGDLGNEVVARLGRRSTFDKTEDVDVVAEAQHRPVDFALEKLRRQLRKCVSVYVCVFMYVTVCVCM